MTISTVAVIGAGTMGAGIAVTSALSGFETFVFDLSETTLERAQTRASKYFNRLVEKGRLAESQAIAALGRLHPTRDLTDVGDTDLVIEAIHEDLSAKQALFAKLSGIVKAETVVATNTSALRVADLAGAITAPKRFLGMHYFSPAEINPLVELVSHEGTSEQALGAAEAFLVQNGKSVLRCKDANGFAVNRFFCPYANEAVRLLDDGVAYPGQIDQVARQVFDLAMGPFEVMAIVKLRIMLNAVQNLSGLGPFYAPAAGLIEAGTAGTGWTLEPEPKPLAPDATAKITDRLRASVWLPVLEAAAEGVATPEGFDMGARLALRFGRGPVETMQDAGLAEVSRVVSALAQRTNHPIPKAGLSQLFG